MVEVTITIDGDQKLIKKMSQLGARVSDMRAMFETLYVKFTGETRKIFLTRGGAQPWDALSPRYAKWKARRFPGKTILRRTDRLFMAATGQSDERLKKITATDAEFGVDAGAIKYAISVQARRSYIRPESVSKHLAKVAGNWVKQLLRRTF